MFGLGKAKAVPPKKERKKDPSQLGMFGMSDDMELGNDLDDDGGDSDFEAELAAITSGGGRATRPKPKSKVPNVVANLDAMIAASLKDIGSDEELSGDDDDPNLLNELSEITGEEEESAAEEPEKASLILPTTSGSQKDLISARIEMYKAAEASAKGAGDTSKARRFGRGLTTLNGLLKQVNAGKTVNESEIPPEVSVKGATTPASAPVAADEPAAPTPPQRKAPPPPSFPPPAAPVVAEEEKSIEQPSDSKLEFLKNKQAQFKAAALDAKKSGDSATAIKYIKIVKQFDTVIQAHENGQEIDLSNMPKLPGEETKAATPPPKIPPRPAPREEAEVQNSSGLAEETAEENIPEPTLIVASSIEEALTQHLEKYKSVEQVAKDEGNSSKARRIGRIVKQYEQALKAHKAGKPVAFDELPTPPGYAPIPIPGAAAPPKPTPQPSPVPPRNPGTSGTAPQVALKPAPAVVPKPATRMSQQLTVLLQRQKEFKLAAVEAKKNGEIEQAKEYLRIFKGLEQLVETAKGGLPVDMATVPIPPSKRAALEDSFQFVNDEECADSDNDDSSIRVRLEEQLSKQLIMCKNTRDHHRAMGDVAGTNRFENWALTVQKDLDFVRLAHRKKLSLPKFHYETRSFSIVRCNTDLTDNEVEIQVVRGINYNVPNPKDVDTYVKVEFPYPQDDPFKTKTPLVKDTDNPDYNQRYSVEIQRSQRTAMRVFKRGQAKFEIYSKGGFLRSDTLVGTVLVKIQPLESVCEIHDSFPLMDGRKTAGGKLEVKIRVRNPLLVKQIEQVNEKWLIIDT